MPSIKKQTPNSPTRTPRTSSGDNGQDVLSRIAELRDTKIGRLKFSVYGIPKTGKTRFGATFPKPLLIIGTEDGTASIVGTPGISFVKIASTAEFHRLVTVAARSGRWSTIMVDNATGLRNMRIDELWAEKGYTPDNIPEKKPFMYADREWKEVWTNAGKDVRNLLGLLLGITDDMDLNVFIIAHEQNLQEDGQGTSDIIKPTVGSALGKTLSMWLNGECDYICQTFIRRQVASKTIQVPGKKAIVKQVQTGKKEFCILVGPHETYCTGFRMPLGRPDPPDVIVDPTYDKIVKLIQG